MNPGGGQLGSIVWAAFLNALNNHRHRGLDEDGDGALDYAADSGAANAYVIALAPALTAYITGMPLLFKAANANTGASTLNVNGLGVKNIKRTSGAALTVGDIKAGGLVCVVYDGTNFQLAGLDNADTLDGQHAPAGTIVGTTDAQTLSSKTLTAPTVADFTNALHDHGAANKGGKVSAQLGAWESKVKNTVYQAGTDGLVMAMVKVTSEEMDGYTDAANPPTTLRLRVHTATGLAYNAFTFPVRKGDYWKVTLTATELYNIWWMPIGQ
ncbi:MAG: hypothetical protein Q8J64_00395 [Thermodesulfovibrionales bacterium]|nr:hypothetical protein [Thermodesulfovibrionales bacterium]